MQDKKFGMKPGGLKVINDFLAEYDCSEIEIAGHKIVMEDKRVHILLFYFSLPQTEETKKTGEHYIFKYKGYSDFSRDMVNRINKGSIMPEMVPDLISNIQAYNDPNGYIAVLELQKQKKKVFGKDRPKRNTPVEEVPVVKPREEQKSEVVSGVSDASPEKFFQDELLPDRVAGSMKNVVKIGKDPYDLTGGEKEKVEKKAEEKPEPVKEEPKKKAPRKKAKKNEELVDTAASASSFG